MTIHSSFLSHADAGASLAFHRVTLGFDYRVCDCAFRDPAGNMIRIQEERLNSGQREIDPQQRQITGAARHE